MPENSKATKKRKPPKPSHTHYYVRITSWEVACGVFTYKERRNLGSRYLEGFGAEIQGTFLYPKKLQGQPVRIRIDGDRGFADIIRRQREEVLEVPRLGWVQSWRGESSIWCSLPLEMIPSIPHLLSTDHLRFASFHGEIVVRGQGQIEAAHLHHRLFVDNCPEIEEDEELAQLVDQVQSAASD